MSGAADPAEGPAGPETGAEASGSPTRHALRVLEFPRVLELVAGHATSPLGAERVRQLHPLRHRSAVSEALGRTDEMVGFLMREEGWSPPEIPDARDVLRRLGVEGSELEGEELLQVAHLLGAARAARRALLPVRESFPKLGRLADPLLKRPELQERLERSLEPPGSVTDAASRELAAIRSDLRKTRSDLVSRLERHAARLSDRIRVPDASVTVRNGRYCIPIRREGRSEVGGIVHDESASQQTLFVEPPFAIEPMNEIRELESRERREVRRVLRDLTEAVRPDAAELRRALELLVELDALYARGRYSLRFGGSRPEIGEEGERGELRVHGGFHPLLLAGEGEVVGFSLELRAEERVLLISGPNAGGKTVLLKSVGLLSAMAQSGILPPVGSGTRLPLFRGFFAVIGDEQSIEASLSTFSAQVGQLRTILERGERSSLVLVDEIGSNTDPSEGGALAAATLRRLAGQAGLTVATTHLGALKSLAEEDGRIVNASLQFDAERLRPSFQLVRDRPGRSYALEIASRLGFPAATLEEARSRLSRTEREMEDTLAGLEEAEREAEARLREARRDSERMERRAAELREREEALESRERVIEREARRRAERYLLEARREVEETIERFEKAYAESGPAGERAASEARSEVEGALRRTREARPAEPREPAPGSAVSLQEGDTVRIRSLDRTGRLAELRGDRGLVEAAGMRLSFPMAELEPIAEGAEPAGGETPPASGVGELPAIEASHQVDLRGLRVEEVEARLLPALDAAILADLSRFQIIHGKGTGALRARVREILRADARIEDFRDGGIDEGGSGVTVVVLDDVGS